MSARQQMQFYGAHSPGFSLLEVIVALFIATVGLFSLSSMQISAIKGNGSSNERMKATCLAQNTLERFKEGNGFGNRVNGFSGISAASPGTLLDAGSVGGIDESGEAGGPYTLQWRVAAHTNWSRSISVSVSWKSILGLTRSVRLSSISRGGAPL
jgi:prepilin-type N-terminal cleavage/methylation domain-containing protein